MTTLSESTMSLQKLSIDETERMLPQDENEGEQFYQHNASRFVSSRQRWSRTFASFILGALTILALSSVSRHTHPTQQLVPGRTMPVVREGIDNQTGLPNSWLNGDCGNSPAEAEARGCRFSMVLLAWVPPGCLTESDAEDDRLMFGYKDWPLIVDGKNVSWTEVQKGHFRFFRSTIGWHTTHCMFAWRRLHRVLLNTSQQLDSYIASEHHTRHCMGVLDRINGDFTRTSEVGIVKFPTCA
ncbi:hypothetical protein HIM_04787 [Hirsutella minnesotensis 3608]|uniref:Uncharacterized protein n=1 Tax=Hirsutella minnesotensis 3608 TaxID=1043627 RepID=A0A0F7ZV43_9HYPO|nr:hypothetical protein HIM_04787 [Hirsutella minnesotensis 3608]